MIKVGIELPDEKIYGVDMSRPELGNPGVGGSEYLFALLASELSKKGIDVTIYHYSDNLLPLCSNHHVVQDSVAIIAKAEEDGISVLIHQVGKPDAWYERLGISTIRSVAWAHVYLDYRELKALRRCDNVSRVVFVGKEEYDSYIDDDIILKSTYIFNMIPTVVSAEKRTLHKLTVTYVGSLVPAKGFHKLAEIWPEVLKEVPDAELNVIGNGKVYDRNAKLGKFGIAQEDYENGFIQYLLDKNGDILPSVHFLGLVGAEKKEIFAETTVGVVNPTALTETFCMSAVEMEYAYIPVISRGKWGLLDTIQDNHTGFLFHNQSEFIRRMVTLLKNPEQNRRMGENAHKFAKETFSVDVIIPNWIELIHAVDGNLPVQYHGVQRNWGNDYKWAKRVIRFVRFEMGMKVVPSFHDLKNALKKMIRR